MIKSKIILTKGLQVDLAEHIRDGETYVAGQNLRVYSSRERADVTLGKIEGTREVRTPAAGFNAIPIGRVEDPDNDRVFVFFHNVGDSRGDSIHVYDRGRDEVMLVMSNFVIPDKSLSFSPDRDNMIQAALNGPILYFTDDNNEPYRINVERGLLTFYPAYTPLEQSSDLTPYDLTTLGKSDLTVIRRPPQFPLVVAKKVSSQDPLIPDQVNNFVGQNAFQFTYRYKYRDGEYSVPAIFSQMLTQNNDDRGEDFDTIQVIIDQREEIPFEVQTIEILARSGNTGSFYIIKAFDRSRDDQEMTDHNLPNRAAVSFYFFNDSRGVAVSDEQAYKLFDTVPLLSKSVEVARNRLFLANNVMDLEQTDIDLSFGVQEYSGKGLNGQYVRVWGRCQRFTGGTGGEEEERKAFDKILVRLSTGDPNVDGYYVTSLVGTAFDSGSLPLNASVSPADRIGGLEYDDDFRLELWMDIEWGGRCYDAIDYQFVVSRNYPGPNPSVYGAADIGGDPFEGAQQLKSDSKYRFGILFFDFAGRTPGVIVGRSDGVVTPDRKYIEPTYNGAVTWEILSGQEGSIPDWATHYSIVRTRNLTRSFFIQSLCTGVTYVEYDDNQVYTFDVNTFDKDKTVGIGWDISRLASDQLGYVYQPGDVLKAYATDDATVVRLPIIAQVGQYVITKAEDIGSVPGIWEDAIIEIYTPYAPSEENEFFYEIGLRFEVLNPGSGSRSFSQMSGTIPGDTFIKQRELETVGFLGCEAMNPNDEFFQQWNTDLGRAFLAFSYTRVRRREVGIVWSEVWIPGTDVNGMSSFNALDEDHIDRNLGPIQKIVLAGRGQQEGTVMLGICQVGSVSMYLGERQLFDAEGDSILATSGAVIGTKNILHGGYGTDHPESVYEEDKKVYWFDVRKGVWVRYASNQLFPISDYGIDAYAKELSKRIGIGSDVRIVSGWNENEKEYWCSIPEIEGWDADVLEDIPVKIIDLGRYAHGDVVYTFEAGKRYRVVLQSTDQAIYLIDYLDPANYLVDYTSPDPLFLVDWNAGPGALCLDYNGANLICLGSTENGPVVVTFTAPITGPMVLNSLEGRPGIVTIYEFGFDNPHSIFNGKPRTMVFKEEADQWGLPFSFTADMIARVGNWNVTWKGNKTWVHDDEVNLNRFYGVDEPAIISILAIDNFSLVRVLKTLAIEGDTPPDWTHIRAEYPNLQSSDLVADDWKTREGVHYAAVMKDRLSPNAQGDETDKLLKGDDVRGEYFFVAFYWYGNNQIKIYFINYGMLPSYGHAALIPGQ